MVVVKPVGAGCLGSSENTVRPALAPSTKSTTGYMELLLGVNVQGKCNIKAGQEWEIGM